MKITINGSPKELAELLDALGGVENTEENHELPPLLTELAEEEKIKNLADTIQPALDKMNERAKQRKENAPQVEAAERVLPFVPILDSNLDDKQLRGKRKETNT